jgi:hypothetical protein
MNNKSSKTIAFALASVLLSAGPLGAQQFEPPKLNPFAFDGMQVHFGMSFAQTFQDLHHRNTAAPVIQDGMDQNALASIGEGFDLPMANASVSADIAPGARVVVNSYLSSRHHTDMWMKGGYLQLDASPIDNDVLQTLMSLVTLKVGQYDVNYGDAHFRQSDNADGWNNPFIENLILDAHTEEPGGEADVRLGPILAVGGITTGVNHGEVTNPGKRGYSWLAKLGWDKRYGDSLRVRLTGSTYQNDRDAGSTLYTGDRAGSAFWGVVDNAAQNDFRNGRVDPGFSRVVHAYQVDPFVQYRNWSAFGVFEHAKGRSSSETETRTVKQYDAELEYDLAGGRAYLAGRYDRVNGELTAPGANEKVQRGAVAVGWHMVDHVLLKGEYVKQTYGGFPAQDIDSGGEFDGIVIQGLVSF